jgi:acyl-ACP thioesterase
VVQDLKDSEVQCLTKGEALVDNQAIWVLIKVDTHHKMPHRVALHKKVVLMVTTTTRTRTKVATIKVALTKVTTCKEI